MYKDISHHVTTDDGCQRSQPLPSYKTGIRFLLTGMFMVSSIYFEGPLHVTKRRNRYILVCVKHLTGWQLAIPTSRSTPKIVLRFVQLHILYSFGPPCVIVSDNASCLTAGTLTDYKMLNSVYWNTVLAYAPMSNGRAERMVENIKRAIKNMALGGG